MDYFQYLRDPFIRWRIWKVYISPIIDWFMPVVFTRPHGDRAAANAIEKFQQKTLAATAKAPRSAPRVELDEIMCVIPAKMRARKVAHRLENLIGYRVLGEMLEGKDIQFQALGITTRGGRRLGYQDHGNDTIWKGAERRDLGDRIFILAHQYDEIDEETKNKYTRDKPETLKFDKQELKAWLRKVKGNIKSKIHDREIRAAQGL